MSGVGVRGEEATGNGPLTAVSTPPSWEMDGAASLMGVVSSATPGGWMKVMKSGRLRREEASPSLLASDNIALSEVSDIRSLIRGSATGVSGVMGVVEVTRGVACSTGARGVACSTDVAGARGVVCSTDVAGARGVVCSTDVAGARGVVCFTDVVGTRGVVCSMDVVGARGVACFMDMAGARGVVCSMDVAGARGVAFFVGVACSMDVADAGGVT